MSRISVTIGTATAELHAVYDRTDGVGSTAAYFESRDLMVAVLGVLQSIGDNQSREWAEALDDILNQPARDRSTARAMGGK